jgi:hypothetical protein
MAPLLALLLGVVALTQQAHGASEPPKRDLVFNITVPDFDVQGEDSYVCTTVKLPDRSMKLVGVEALARQEVVHHILLFGACSLCVFLSLSLHAGAQGLGARSWCSFQPWRVCGGGLLIAPHRAMAAAAAAVRRRARRTRLSLLDNLPAKNNEINQAATRRTWSPRAARRRCGTASRGRRAAA